LADFKNGIEVRIHCLNIWNRRIYFVEGVVP